MTLRGYCNLVRVPPFAKKNAKGGAIHPWYRDLSKKQFLVDRGIG